jgi:hypothetical protein
MDPLNDMCEALVSINNILEKRKESVGDSSTPAINHKRESSLLSAQLKSQNKSNHLHLEPLTEDNFHHAHLCNRNIDELPSIVIFPFNKKNISCSLLSDVNLHDIKQLKSINIYTMQDLLGRFLIHDTLEEFHTFLCSTFRLSEKAATTITDLFDRWTKYNLDGTIDSRKDN